MYLRRVNHPDHTKGAMADLAAVEPDGACVVDGESKDGGLELKKQCQKPINTYLTSKQRQLKTTL